MPFDASPVSPPTAPVSHRLTLCLYEFDFSKIGIIEMIQYLSFCLAYFTWHNVFQIHPCCANVRILFFLKAEIPLKHKSV